MPSERINRVRNSRGNIEVIVGEGASGTGEDHGEDQWSKLSLRSSWATMTKQIPPLQSTENVTAEQVGGY